MGVGRDGSFAHLGKPLLQALRRFLCGAAAVTGSVSELHRAIACAKQLQTVLEKDLLLETELAARGRRPGTDVSNLTWRRRCYKANAKCYSLRKSLEQFKAKTDHRIAWRWAVMAGLGDPTTSTRSVESWCREFAIADAERAPISHTSVGAMRDTFGHVLLDMNKEDVTRYVQGAPHGFVVIRHLHDEASMRLRSMLPSPAAAPAALAPAAAPEAAPAALAPAAAAAAPAAAPKMMSCSLTMGTTARSPAPTRTARYSKIQNSVVTLHRSACEEYPVSMLCELQALARKDSATLATSLRSVASAVCQARIGSRDGLLRLVHCVVGDGVYANQLAARLLWRWMQREGCKNYYLLMFTCSTHAANLVVRSAICTDEEQKSQKGQQGSVDGHPIVATSVRLFKYLLPEFGVNIVESLQIYVSEKLLVHPDELPPRQIQQQLQNLQTLYGASVLPDSLLTCLNGAPGSLEHFGSSLSDRASVVARVTNVLQRLCLRSDEKPVTTRFWTFAECVASLFRWTFLKLPPSEILSTGSKNLREGNQKRIAKVTRFFQNQATRKQLSIACLCLRLTGVATSMTARKMKDMPLLVQLARGDIVKRSSQELHLILDNLSADPELAQHVSEVLERLLVTMGQLVLRFAQYMKYPARVVLLSQRFNPHAFHQHVLDFLYCDEAELDFGYSLPLRQQAWAAGGILTTAIGHLLSENVQREIETIAVAIETSTMDVERKHNLDKRVQHSTVNSVAKASRDSILRSWRLRSTQPAAPAAKQSQAVCKRKRSAKHLGVGSMALAECPELSPALCRDGGASLRQYIAAHRSDLQDKVQAAQAQVAASPDPSPSPAFELSWPLTRACWLEWISENQARFEDVLRDMRNGARRTVNQQLRPLADVPDSAPLLAPKARAPQPSWAKLVRNGWFVLQLSRDAAAAPAAERQENQLVLLVVSAGKEKAAYLPACIPGEGFQVPRNIDLAQGLKPLWQVAPAVFLAHKVSVFRLRMKVASSDGSNWMQPLQATEVVQTPRRGRKQAQAPNRSSKLVEKCSSSGSDTHSAHSKDSLLPVSDSDGRLSFVSTADSSLEEAADSDSAAPAAAAANDSGSGESDRVPRAAAHTHSIWSNDYFVLTDNRNYPNLRMRIQQRWTGPHQLGDAGTSKTVVPAHFGDSREKPDQIVLVLKAWMLHRWMGNDGKFMKRRSRQAAWERERDALAHDVRTRGGRGSLHANALAKIVMWAPFVLDA